MRAARKSRSQRVERFGIRRKSACARISGDNNNTTRTPWHASAGAERPCARERGGNDGIVCRVLEPAFRPRLALECAVSRYLKNGRFPAVQHGCVCFDQVLRGDQRLTSTPVEIVRQATTEAALGSAKHLFGYRNKYFRAAQWRVHFFSLRELRERVSAYRRTDGPMPSAVPPGFSARLHPAPSRIARTNPSRWAGADQC
jgi:hypothetical protein